MRIFFEDYTPVHVGLTVTLEFVITTLVSFGVVFVLSKIPVVKKILL
jgi:hypothetical protein